MGNIWVVGEDANLVAQLLTPARTIAENGDVSDEIYAITVGQTGAEQLASKGAKKVYQLNLEDGRPESACAVIAKCIKENGALIVLFSASPRGRGIAATVAGLLNAGMASEVSSITRENNEMKASRYVYGGLGIATLSFSNLACISIAPDIFMAPEPTVDAKGEIIALDVTADKRVQVLKTTPVKREGLDLATAERVVCVGRGFEKEEDLQLARELATTLNAELGCSRGIAEDLKWLPLDHYIGISGVKIKSNLYLSAGISGQVQHVAGIRDVKTVIAIDNNENAPIFAAADYGIIGNLYDVLPTLNKVLKA